MASQGLVSLFVTFILASSSSAAAAGLADGATYNVLDFGAVGDAYTNDTLAFVNAWSAACHNSRKPSTLIIPAGKTFLLSQIVFEGPCNNFIYVALDGNLKRTNEIWKENFNSWLLFIKINGLTISGSGELDGQGRNWWTCKQQKKCPFIAPHSLELLLCTNAKIWGLRLIDSTMMHIGVGQSEDVEIGRITISAPGDSPNTDGIHVQKSRRVRIRDCTIGTGDDCVSLSDGAEDVSVSNVKCGPGHGISVGSLGIEGTKATATGIYVSNCIISQTTNGVRIKTWQGGSGFARNISFVNITMNEVHYPIIIDQYYCPHSSSCHSQASAVEVSNVKYIGITGSSTSRVAITLNCSQSVPCTGIAMDSVNLWSADEGEEVQSCCVNAHGSSRNQVKPPCPCLTHQ